MLKLRLKGASEKIISKSFICQFALIFILFNPKITKSQENSRLDDLWNKLVLSNYNMTDVFLSEIKSDNEKSMLLFLLGERLERNFKFVDAATCYGMSFSLDSTRNEAQHGILRCLIATGKTNKALDLLDKLIQKDSTNIIYQYQYAQLLKGKGKWGDALNTFSKILAQDSTNSVLLEHVGDCASKLGNAELAWASYSKGILYNPENLGLVTKYLNIAYQIPELSDYCMEIGENALKIDSTYVPILKLLGNIAIRKKDFSLAAKYYLKAYCEGDSSFNTTRLTGIALYSDGKNIKSLHFLQAAYNMDSTDRVLNFIYAKALGETGDRKQALRLLSLNETLIMPDSAELSSIFLEKANIFEYGTDFNNAAKYYKKAYELNRSNSEILYYIARCYDYSKDFSSAIDYYKMYLSSEQGKKSKKENTHSIYDQRRDYATKRIDLLKEELFFNK